MTYFNSEPGDSRVDEMGHTNKIQVYEREALFQYRPGRYEFFLVFSLMCFIGLHNSTPSMYIFPI